MNYNINFKEFIMKKILPILLVSALLLSGCNGGKGGSSAKSS
jgi:hypothetical protein